MERCDILMVLFYLAFSRKFPLVFCDSDSLKLIGKQGLVGKTCPEEDVIFTETAPSKTVCAFHCFQNSDCKGVSYSRTDLTCVGCDDFYATPTSLIDRPDSLFFALENEECGAPPVPDIHVVLGTFDASSASGTQVSYTCTPCTFFPQTEPAVITCQPDGTWSAPTCVYGPNVGKLPNGQAIPAGAIGCASTFGDTCPNKLVNGNALLVNGETGSCYCDNACCSSEDCCFDSTCDDDYDDYYYYYYR